MIVLIAESKTMAPCNAMLSSETLSSHTPVFGGMADDVMSRIATMDAADVVTATKLSAAMAGRLLEMAYEFPNKALGAEAIEAYTGVVFKALSYPTLSDGGKALCRHQARIISSLYGWLRPDDIVKPYRLEFSSPLAPSDLQMSKFWRKDCTIALVKTLREQGEQDVIDLLPADASKCIDWKLVKRFAKVWKIDFQAVGDGGTLRTPHSGCLKTLRGHLLRAILERGLTDASELLTLETDQLLPQSTPIYPDHILFHC